MCFVMDCQRGSLLGCKTLGLNVLELHYVMLANHDQTFSLILDLLKVCLCVKLESSNCRKLLFNFCKARSIKSRAECFFLQNFPTQPKPI